MGDGGSEGDPHAYGQNLRTPLSKLLRINPLRRGARWQQAGYGLRNPWRFSFDRATGRNVYALWNCRQTKRQPSANTPAG